MRLSLLAAQALLIAAPVLAADSDRDDEEERDDRDEREGRTIGSGMASYYADKFNGRRTASGERFDNDDRTAAHRTLPFGSRVRVTHARTGKSVVVRINDRGPWHGGRIIDLSRAAARKIGLDRSGVARVLLSRAD